MPSSIKDWTDLIVLPSSPCIAPNSIITSTSSAQIGLAPATSNNPVARQLESGRVVIDAADFCEVRKMHTRDVVGNRLTKERLDFVCHFAFPPSHAELLPTRQSKKNARHRTPRQWKSWKITQMNLMTLKLKAKIQSLFQDDDKESPAYRRIGSSTKE